MGRHGDSTTFIYRTPKVVIPKLDEQRRILRLGKIGVEPGRISDYTGYSLPTVNNILDRGVVYLTHNEEIVKCPECGAKLVASPCLRCELLTRNN